MEAREGARLAQADAVAEPAARERWLRYRSGVHMVDGEVARVLAALESAGLRDNTLVWFSSDNGPEPITESNSACSRSRTSGFLSSSHQIHDKALEEVSCPPIIIPRASSAIS